MFDFVDNQIIRILLEVIMALFTGVLGFFGGMKYTNKKNKIGNILNSDIGSIKEEMK